MTLKNNDVHITFFMVGDWVDKYPEAVKKIYEAGHEIGSHSNTHPHVNNLSSEKNLEEINLGDFTYLSNSRQISLVKKAVEISKNLEDALNNDVPIDLLEIDIKEICEILGEIIGESYDDKLIDTLFSNFCLGK